MREQQSNLCCLGVPLFQASMEAEQLRLQMDLIKFILSLGDLFPG